MLWNHVSHTNFLPRCLSHWSFLVLGLGIIYTGHQEPQCVPAAPITVVSPQPTVFKAPSPMRLSPMTFKSVSRYPVEMGIEAQAQSTQYSDGQCCVAMCVQSLTGKSLRDEDINSKYGFQLLDALNSETQVHGWKWKDGGEVSPKSWTLIERKVLAERTPVIVALNGPEFSPSGKGHIVVVVRIQGQEVTLADPATGTFRHTTKKAMNEAPSHPHGNFIFYADKHPQVSP